jgi:hypothetical protein
MKELIYLADMHPIVSGFTGILLGVVIVLTAYFIAYKLQD